MWHGYRTMATLPVYRLWAGVKADMRAGEESALRVRNARSPKSIPNAYWDIPRGRNSRDGHQKIARLTRRREARKTVFLREELYGVCERKDADLREQAVNSIWEDVCSM